MVFSGFSMSNHHGCGVVVVVVVVLILTALASSLLLKNKKTGSALTGELPHPSEALKLVAMLANEDEPSNVCDSTLAQRQVGVCSLVC
jgi:hypothetical protein